MSGAPALRTIPPAAYPARLRHVGDAPARLWALGAAIPTDACLVAVVGARKATSYGLDVARGLAADLAAEGVWVVSGMALGVDAAAHDGALSVGGRTVAVLGSGADVAYPATNRGLYERIIAGGGAVLSEQPPGTAARKEHFKPRNRIIAGMADAVVVVQAATGSGAMSTAGFAGRYGAEIFAVPGDVRSSLSVGTHALIRDGASLLAAAEDLIGILREAGRLGGGAQAWSPAIPGLADDERELIDAIAAGPGGVEVLARRAGLAVLDAARTLARLELRGLVARSPSGEFGRARARM